MNIESSRPLVYTLAGCAIIELCVFLWLGSMGPAGFAGFVSAADTESYAVVARQLVQTGKLVTTDRTLGYPLILSLGILLGGERYGMHIIVAAQLGLNLVLVWGFWISLRRMAPDLRTIHLCVATSFLFYAGLGMALYVLSDFLASFFFGIFLYGLLFRRSWTSVALSGAALAAATLIRPTFTFVPVLLPAAAYLVKRCTSRIGGPAILVFTGVSLAATGISCLQQRSADGYLGPSPILTLNLQRVLYHAVEEEHMTQREHRQRFEAVISERAGRPYASLSRGEQEKLAKSIFLEELRSHPRAIALLVAATPVKYVLAPVESTIARVVSLSSSEEVYRRNVRPILGLLCLPIWVLSLIPAGGTATRKSWYLLSMLFLLYVVGVSSITPFQGERVRFPVLPLILHVAVWNAEHLQEKLWPLRVRPRAR